MDRVLITGAGGFIGSHLAEKMVAEGYRVRAFLRYNSRNSLGYLADSKYRKEMEIFHGNIRDADAVSSAVRGCSTICHLAALIGIPYSYRSPLAYIRTNIEGTYNVLESALKKGVRNIIITSTSEVYGGARHVPIREDDPVDPRSPYAATKTSADQLGLSFYRSFGLPVKIVRPFNTYGPRQSARAIIPVIIAQALTSERIRLGNIKPSRDFTYVEDTVGGFIKAVESSKCVGEIVNLGTGSEISIGDLARKIVEKLSRKCRIVIDRKRIRPSASEVNRLCADVRKARAMLKWRTMISLDEGLKRTIEWIEQHTDLYTAGAYVV